MAFVIHLASRTKGRLGELFLDEIADGIGLRTRASGSADFDRFVVCPDGTTLRIETKFSTEDPPRFQQVRSPILGGGKLKYDYLVCLSGRPEGMAYWVFEAGELGGLMDSNAIKVQHAMSDTRWFFPQRISEDGFGAYRMDYAGFKDWLRSLCG
ncbi:MAG: hypothetical protein H0U90_02055 [Actinobacteria bacterium]|nr:hypothetical protein [Actinomycetota bacterium]